MFKIHSNPGGEFWFTICSTNGSKMATSETYPSKANVRRAVRGTILSLGIDTVKIFDCTHIVKEEISLTDL